ncbi:hypothetical protein N657DRAFT_622822 [Parathielavia appendiculata]|uniref:Uncharacterized protein n=1 Tax=Parathielavia appendiculata TaxID=2587402 RepID=A0AAN6TVH9_9PEZI|nr:hypothetical protein N657DRAFT_622822 [Parathielavia appendiculata]
MLRANIAKFPLRGSGARPLTRQPRITNVRTAMYKNDGPDGTTSTLVAGPKTYAMVGGLIMTVMGTYGYMMSHPQDTQRVEGSPVSTTEAGAAPTKK